jgi:subtilisin family serine protease
MRLPRTHTCILSALAIGIGTALAAAPATAAAPPLAASSGSVSDSGRYVVVLKPTVSHPAAVAADQAGRFGAAVSKIYRSALKGYAATIPSSRLASLRADDWVQYVAPDTQVTAFDSTGTGIKRMRAVDKTNNAAGVNVAVIDTGIDLDHPDLAANIVGGTNCSKGSRSNYDDGNGHGTHVAGVIAAADNGVGIVGVAPEAKLWAVRVLDSGGSGSTSDVICGIDYVDSKSPGKGGPITVANMSLGGWGTDDGNCGATNADPMHAAICRAVTDGVTFVVAAGNSTADVSQTRPAGYDEVLTVTALGDSDGQPCAAGAATAYSADDAFATFSNFATSAADQAHTVAAPGVGIYSTYKGGGYATLNGTSMASPHVAGAAALYLAAHPGATPSAVRSALRAAAEPNDVNFNGECPASTSGKRGGTAVAGVSHRDTSTRHPEPVLRADTL